MTESSRTTPASTQETGETIPDTRPARDVSHVADAMACPSWCTAPQGHGWDIRSSDRMGIRDHVGPRFGEYVSVSGSEQARPVGAVSYCVQLDEEAPGELDVVAATAISDQLLAAAAWVERMSARGGACPPWCTDHQEIDGLPGGFHQGGVTLSQDVEVRITDDGIDNRVPCIRIYGHEPDDGMTADEAEALAAQLNHFAIASKATVHSLGVVA